MNALVNEFMDKMNNLDQKEYLYDIITYGMAPTISGDKCATLINLSNKYMNSYSLWKENKKEFIKNIPLKYYELNITYENYTVLFYDAQLLENVLCEDKSIKFLEGEGYQDKGSVDNLLNTLRKNYGEGCPYEIGLFLGIPLHDVLGFRKNSGKNYLYSGYWKVYEDVKGAKMIFHKYDSVKKRVMKAVSDGKSYKDIIDILN
ncbi:DUF3793 family protein [Clostridium sp. YIM B02515]|uniref:DUF3793 family protein n=1 Tax=Clostridium rhizosphaerae TaxID=2803861 RepID=A0ABS1T936_9CLOT|nr:DUF3793 family protein [Clostridium rhizosphaerae]MBL4935287.1 DUF3793 family protein [Clostridium rhizosphaerae]